MNWLKSIAAPFVTIFLVAAAVMAARSASRNRKLADKWQGVAVGETETGVAEDAELARIALDQAQQHADRAEAAIARSHERINQLGARDETTADIVDRWRADRMRERAARSVA